VSAWLGGDVSERVHCVLAPNASPMTLDGTNTWVLADPGGRQSVVIDPGPLDEGHLAAVLAKATAGDRAVGLVIVTHRHPDHTEGAARFAELAQAPVRAVEAEFRERGGGGLDDGERITVDGLDLQVLATPGHSSDSVTLLLPADRAILTGDTVLGRGTTVVAHPDGKLADYLASLERLHALTTESVAVVYPGHGPMLPQAGEAIAFYLKHRQERLDQVRAAVAAGDTTPRQVVERVYADVDPVLWPYAEMSVAAQLEYLGVNADGRTVD
jgi:glyoxylase-like metal-dependent hydrolase (beta-lactamase superfamily II)